MTNEKKEIYTGKRFSVYELNGHRLLGVIGENSWAHSLFKTEDPTSLHSDWSKTMMRPIVFIEEPKDIILIGAGGAIK
ncbi:MAG: hypothetical protein V4695_00400 [Pseudomonadota bacterium]